jgi:hypothetical protein
LISPLPQPSWTIWQTNREVVAEVDRLLDDHTDSRIAAMLNERGWHPGKGGLFTKGIKQYLYEPVGTNPPYKQQGVKRTDLLRFPTAFTENTKEGQDEA